MIDYMFMIPIVSTGFYMLNDPFTMAVKSSEMAVNAYRAVRNVWKGNFYVTCSFSLFGITIESLLEMRS